MKKKLLAILMVIGILFSASGCEAARNEQLKRDDFYEYVNQELLSDIELTASDAYWDWFGELNAIVLHDMRDIITELKAMKTETLL